MSTCGAWARFHEDDVEFDVECDNVIVHPEIEPRIHHDPDLGYWDTETGLHDRSLTPAESRLKR